MPLPIIDIASLVTDSGDAEGVAQEIRRACTDEGFFYVVGHGIDVTLQDRLDELSRQFFALPLSQKMEIRMALGGRAWRGYFPVGDELTSGKPDVKEGLYFGAELGPEDPRVRAGLPLHGANLFPSQVPEFRGVILEYLDAMTRLGHALMEGVALSLGLDRSYFRMNFMREPTTLFRIFHYPPIQTPGNFGEVWGVGEHTDYGVLTILRQDAVGGLQVKSQGAWLTAPPIENAFVCNIGDMLDRMTGGFYRSTPHRVRNVNRVGRMSYPFFFDPGFDAEVGPIDFPGRPALSDDVASRWDRASVHEFRGTYGDYLVRKVSKVFPQLVADVSAHKHQPE